MAFFKTINLIMIINKGTINEVAVTVTEQTTLSVPVYYLFELHSKSTEEKTYFIGTNTSTQTGRYDLFNIEDKASPVAENGEVDLQVGEYWYRIYQQNSTTNLNPAATTIAASGFAYVEQGLCQVYEAETATPTYTGASVITPTYEQ